MSQNSTFVSHPQRLAALFAEQLAAPMDVGLKFAACRQREVHVSSAKQGECLKTCDYCGFAALLAEKLASPESDIRNVTGLAAVYAKPAASRKIYLQSYRKSKLFRK